MCVCLLVLLCIRPVKMFVSDAVSRICQYVKAVMTGNMDLLIISLNHTPMSSKIAMKCNRFDDSLICRCLCVKAM